MLIGTMSGVAQADDVAERVRIADPYLDMRSGPGRGYPVFYIAERGETVTILKRRTDWFQVRTEKGKTGWASRAQMERTLTEAGVSKTFRDVLYEDYLRRRFEAGFSFGSIKGEGIAERDVILTGNVGYRFNDNQSLELSLSQISDDFFSGRFVYLSLVSQPYPSWTVSPTISLGFGKGRIEPKTTLINVPDIDTEMANAGVGARFYFTRRFFARADFRVHRLFVDDADRADKFEEASVGIGFFF